MKKNRNPLFLLLAIIVATSYISLQVVKADSLQITSSNNYLVAGQENEIIINIKNIGDREVVGVQAILSSTSSGITILEGSQKAYTDIDNGKKKSYPVIVYVDKSLPLGSYSLTLMVTYQKITFEFVTATVSIGVVVSETYVPNLGFSYLPTEISATAGENEQLIYSIKNLSNKTLENLELNLQSTSTYINIVDEDTINIDSLLPNEILSIAPSVMVLENTPLSTYSVDVTASFTDENEHMLFEAFSLPINVNAAKISRTTTVTIKDIEINPEQVQPGDVFKLRISVECKGADAFDLMGAISFTSTTPISPLSPSTINLGDIGAGDSADMYYDLLVSGGTSAGQYSGIVTLTYTSSRGQTKTLTEPITILIDGLIEFDLLDTPDTPGYIEETNELEADILLLGTESIEFVSISLVEDMIFRSVDGSEEYIGAIDPDSPIPFDLLYKVDENAEPGTHQMNLLIKYRDHLNKPHETLLDVDVEVSAGSVAENGEESNGGFWNWLRNLFR